MEVFNKEYSPEDLADLERDVYEAFQDEPEAGEDERVVYTVSISKAYKEGL